eukprot:jgi/Chrzof1/9732/Cz04g13230.t1
MQRAVVYPLSCLACGCILLRHCQQLSTSAPQGDRYIDAWILDKRLSKVPGKPISDKPFYLRTGTHPSLSCGPGSNDGCLNEIPLDTDGSAAANRSKPIIRTADKLKNIYATTPKKGGFGMPWKDRTLGAPPVYYMDGYEGGRQKEKEMRSQAKAISKPFVSRGRTGRSFTPDPQIYARPPITAPETSKPRQSVSAGSASSSSKDRPNTPAWRPSSPPKKGAAYCILSTVGRDHVPDPVREAQHHANTKASSAAFRPVSGSRARLSMWSPNPYSTDPRPAPDIDFTLFR